MTLEDLLAWLPPGSPEQDVARQIDEEVRAIVDRSHTRAIDLLTTNRNKLDAVVAASENAGEGRPNSPEHGRPRETPYPLFSLWRIL